MTALLRLCGAVIFGLVLCLAAGPAAAKRVTPIVVDEAFGISGPAPWASPSGEQLITYLRQDDGALPVPGLTARTGGAPFTPFEALSARPGLAPPTAGFGPDGTARLVWLAGGTGNLTEQAVRPAGGPLGAPAPAGACNGPTALAVSGSGRTLSACRADSGATARWIGLAGVGQMPTAIAPEVELTPAVGELTSDPLVAWGADGTGIVAFGYRDGEPPEGWKIAARIVAPDGSLGETELVDSATDPATLVPTGVAVQPNGTIAITANSSDGALLFTRAAGSGRPFERVVPGGDTASMPAADRWGRLHFLTSSTDGSGALTWASRVLDLNGTLRNPLPVPTLGTDFVPVQNGFQVFPGGGEALVMKSSGGFSVFFRNPGPNGFFLGRVLAQAAAEGTGAVTQSPAGDLLLTWTEASALGRKRLMLGGWDANGRPVIDRISAPRRTKRGIPITLSVLASDPMGISRIIWTIPRNRTVEGASVKVRLRKRGVNLIQVSVFDRAGNRAARTKRVKVFVPKRPARQGRPGTSGSPRP